jgi:YadA-like protein/trimeric autotransporter adhesin
MKVLTNLFRVTNGQNAVMKMFSAAAVTIAMVLIPLSVSAQEEGFTNLFPAGSGTATNPDDLTLGRLSQANGGGTFTTGATAIGSNAFALGAGSTSVGSDSGPGVTLAGVTSIGANANFNNATGIFSTAMGAGATQATGPDSSGNYSIAIGGGDGVGGVGANASGAQAIAVGLSSVASGVNSVAIGSHSTASGGNSIAMSADAGFAATASGAFSTVIGDNSSATNTEGLSVGTNLTNTGAFATNVGNNNSVTGADASAFGVGNSVSGNSAGAFGAFNTASGANSYAIGNGAAATNTNALAIGTNASAGFVNSTAIGNGATVTRANQMAFGTATNTYTMPGITSAASTAAQAGPTSFVTTDNAGNLAAVNLGPTFSAFNQEINTLSGRIHDVRQEERGGVALAMAAGQIRYDDRPGKVSIGGGLGVFEDEGGGALGIGFTSPNARVRGNISAGGSFRGDFGGGAGLSITLN